MTDEQSDRKEESLKIRVPIVWKRSLKILAHGESVSALCRNAIAEYLDRHQEEIQAAENAFASADRQFRAAVQASAKKKPSVGAAKRPAATASARSRSNRHRHHRVNA